jgi:hypothetical protein
VKLGFHSMHLALAGSAGKWAERAQRADVQQITCVRDAREGFSVEVAAPS